mgnify:CR=1 FL=1
MAITRTTELQRVDVHPAMNGNTDTTTNEGNPSLRVCYNDVFDDSTDDNLPVATQRVLNLERFVITLDDEGVASSAARDVSGEDQLVQDICAAIWTD